MKFKINNKYLHWGLTAFAVIAAGITFYYFIFNSSNIMLGVGTAIDILKPVLFGLVTAYLLTPALNFVEARILIPVCDRWKIKKSARRKKLIRALGILITAFLFVALIYILISMLVSQIVPSVQGLIDNFDSYVDNVSGWITQVLEDNEDFGNYVTKTLNKYSEQFENWVNHLLPETASLIRTLSLSFIGILDVLWDFVIGFVISIYVLASKEQFASQAKKVVYAVFERNTANTVIRNFRFTHRTFIGFLSGKIVDSIIIGILCFIGTTLMGTPYAMLISLIIGVTNIIPFFGPFLGAIPSVILIFVVDPLHPLNALYFAIFALALQQFDGNILGPKILGSSTGLTGFWVIFSITFFGGLFGVLGMIVGVPIFAILYAAIRSLVNSMLEKKSLPSQSDEYENVEYIDEEGLHLTPVKAKQPKEKKRRKTHSGAADTEEENGKQ
ncbi:MAG: AI-2E family transporter [Lachnospiraceae bacterium]|nr:AI-2E family transporter [Lachnospiraceae bacterium]